MKNTLDSIFFTPLFVSERKQIAMIADCISEQLPNLAQWQLPCASKSMRCPARIRTFIPVMEAAVHHIGIKIV